MSDVEKEPKTAKESKPCIDAGLSEAGRRLRASRRPGPGQAHVKNVCKPSLKTAQERAAFIEEATAKLLNGEISAAAFRALAYGITRMSRDKSFQGLEKAMKKPRIITPVFARPRLRTPELHSEPIVEAPEPSTARPAALPAPHKGGPAWARCPNCSSLNLADPARPDVAWICQHCGQTFDPDR